MKYRCKEIYNEIKLLFQGWKEGNISRFDLVCVKQVQSIFQSDILHLLDDSDISCTTQDQISTQKTVSLSNTQEKIVENENKSKIIHNTVENHSIPDQEIISLTAMESIDASIKISHSIHQVPWKTTGLQMIIELLNRINERMNFIWEKMHYFQSSWKDILKNSYLPDLYMILSLCSSALQMDIGFHCEDYSKKIEYFKKAIKCSDWGILMGRRSNSYLFPFINFYHKLVEQANMYHMELVNTTVRTKKRHLDIDKVDKINDKVEKKGPDYFNNFISKGKININDDIVSSLPIQDTTVSVEIMETPTMILFYENYMSKGIPVLITEVMKEWPAIGNEGNSWQDIDYLKEVAGYRTVPVEIGRNYLSQDASQVFMTMNEFFDDFICPNQGEFSKNMAYLAQHELLEQIPILKKDVIIPDYCSLLLPEDEDKKDEKSVEENDEVIVNSWFGPVGTVSPLHHDPYHNLLAQVSGYKYVRLYHPKESHKLYPREGILSNNSKVDLTLFESEMYRNQYPLILEAQCSETILFPGEMLFIPRWYWHFIVSVNRDTAMTLRSSCYHLSFFCSSSSNSIIQSYDSSKRNISISRDLMTASVSFWWGKRILKPP